MSKRTVLVVDDEIGIRTLIEAILEEGGWQAVLAGTPSQALRLAERDQPDMAILDYMLPEMDGIELGRQLRARFGPTFPLIFISAMDMPAARTAELSSFLFISKPFDIGSVIEAVEAALAPVQPRPMKRTESEALDDTQDSERGRRATG